MILVCPSCRYHSNDFQEIECPRCGLDLHEPVKRRADKRPRKLRREANEHRQTKRSRRNPWNEVETF